MFEEQPGLAVDQEHVLDAEHDRVLEHHVGEGAPAAISLEAPLQPAPRKAVLERLVEALQRAVQRLGDGLANRRPIERVEDADQGAGILADRRLGRALHVGARTSASCSSRDSARAKASGQHGTDGFGELLRVVELLLQAGECGPILLQEDAAQRLQPRIAVEPAGEHRRQVPIDAARHLQQQVGKALGCGHGPDACVGGVRCCPWRPAESLAITASPIARSVELHAPTRSDALQRGSGALRRCRPCGVVSWFRQRAISTNRPASRLRSVLTLLSSGNIRSMVARVSSFRRRISSRRAWDSWPSRSVNSRSRLASWSESLAEALLQSLDVLPQAASQLLVGLGAQVLLLADLAGDRFQLLLDRGLQASKAAGRLPFHVPQPLLKALLEHREAAVVVLHLVAEQQLADLVDARRVRAARVCWPGLSNTIS